ncbi:hypothetical protein KC19_10G187600 [Ceratodon purpureus]|uniref:Uncharacterized protein n=1 Tax=Ceratodon purpureus TaxID=3225 RepID=A0A8T0GND0_CERPU|nr:hypothetical protein KC19_10G187600 [Ceratodon purpureus]
MMMRIGIFSILFSLDWLIEVCPRTRSSGRAGLPDHLGGRAGVIKLVALGINPCH